jgi:hypothetical protein
MDQLLHESVADFLQENRDHGVDFQNIQIPDYLAIHLAAQRAIQDRPLLMYGVTVHDAELGPYRQLATVHGWDSRRFCREYFVPGLNLQSSDKKNTGRRWTTPWRRAGIIIAGNIIIIGIRDVHALQYHRALFGAARRHSVISVIIISIVHSDH